MRMVYGREDLRFAFKPGTSFAVLGERRRKYLERYVSVQESVTGAPHFAHAARPYQRHHAIRTEDLTFTEDHSRRGLWHLQPLPTSIRNRALLPRTGHLAVVRQRQKCFRVFLQLGHSWVHDGEWPAGLIGTFLPRPSVTRGPIHGHRSILPASLHLPVAVTEGSLTEKLNKTGVRFWTDCSNADFVWAGVNNQRKAFLDD